MSMEEVKHSNPAEDLYLPLKHIQKDIHCGHYIQDDLGDTVCDFYFKKDGKVIDHGYADKYATFIAKAVNMHEQLVKSLDIAIYKMKEMTYVGVFESAHLENFERMIEELSRALEEVK